MIYAILSTPCYLVGRGKIKWQTRVNVSGEFIANWRDETLQQVDTTFLDFDSSITATQRKRGVFDRIESHRPTGSIQRLRAIPRSVFKGNRIKRPERIRWKNLFVDGKVFFQRRKAAGTSAIQGSTNEPGGEIRPKASKARESFAVTTF